MENMVFFIKTWKRNSVSVKFSWILDNSQLNLSSLKTAYSIIQQQIKLLHIQSFISKDNSTIKSLWRTIFKGLLELHRKLINERD